MPDDKLKVLFISPEMVPFAKTGGLADVAGSLPYALKNLGVDVRVVMPLYRTVKQSNVTMRPIVERLKIPLGESTLRADVMETQLRKDLPVYMIQREDFFDRPNLYGNAWGDYYDNLERFTFFSYSALEIAKAISFQPDIIHCHDWQSGLIPALLKEPYQDDVFFKKTKTVFTIHNLGYQGLFASDKLSVTGLSRENFYHMEGLEYWGKVSLLKAGIEYADAITTVSPTYAQEIQAAEQGMGMEGILKRRRDVLYGILNGMDYDLWNPSKDTHISAKFSPQKMTGKSECKEALIQEMGLEPALKRLPILGMISRLDVQKGLGLLVDMLDEIVGLDTGLVILGSGNEDIQIAMQDASKLHSGRIGIKIGFDEPLAHRIIAASDMFLIPSRYEPCGLTQMYALKYGTVPIVRATGGLDDTIKTFDPKTGEGNGFKFKAFKTKDFLEVIKTAVEYFRQPKVWKKIMRNGMKEDFCWDRSARQYLKLFLSLVT